MSTGNKKNIASKALLDMDTIMSAIKEESKKSLKSLLNEAAVDALREACKEDEEDDVEIYNGDENAEAEKAEAPAEAEPEKAEAPAQEEEPAQEEVPADGAEEVPQDGGDGEEDEYSQYKVGDDAYDLTGEEDYDKVVKVYKLLNNDDQIVVKQDGDKINIKDNENGTEYVVDLGTDDEEAPVDAEVEEPKAELNESDIAGIGDEVPSDEEADIDATADMQAKIDELQAELDRLKDEKEAKAEYEITEEQDCQNMEGNEEQIFEVDLGYTDDYQDKNPIDGLSVEEPSKSGVSCDAGVPKTAEKPWAGDAEGEGEPFEEPVEEGTNVGGAVQQRSMSKSHIPAGRKAYGPKAKHNVSAEGEYEALVAENTTLRKRVKELTEAVLAIRKNLSEAYVTNANLGKITKLFLENTTSKAEKAEIVNRFTNEAKTIEQSKALYESISRELKKTSKTITMEGAMSKVEGSKQLNESKTYVSDDLVRTLDLMKRMANC